MKLETAAKQYLEHVSAEHSANTLRSYQGRLKSLVEQLGNKKVDKLKPKHIEKWIKEVTHWSDGEPKAPDTIRLTVIAWEQLQSYMLAAELIEEPIYQFGKKPGGRKRTRIPTKLEQARLFREALLSGHKEFALIFRCLRLCGARPGELARASIADYDREQSLITLAEHKTARKTGEPRLIGVGRIMRRLILGAIGGRTSGPIFRDEKDNRWTVNKISHLYRRFRDKLGLSKDLVLYCARHEHGTYVCQTHGIHAAQHSLGHRDIQTTQRYVHPDPANLAGYQDAI